MPETLSLARALSHTVAPAGRQPAASAASCSLGVPAAAVKQRWLIVWSPAAYQRALGPVRTPRRKQSPAPLQAFEPLCRQDFTGEPDARHAWARFDKTLTLTTVRDSRLGAVPPYRRVGGPPTDRAPAESTYRSDGALASRPAQDRQRLPQPSGVILATKPVDSAALPAAELRRAYPDQQKVERGFRFRKAPLFRAATRDRKSPNRLIARLRVMTLCRLVCAALAYRRRQALQPHDHPFPHHKGPPRRTPTSRWGFPWFTGLHLWVIAQHQVLVLNLNEPPHRLLAVLGERDVALYSHVG